MAFPVPARSLVLVTFLFVAPVAGAQENPAPAPRAQLKGHTQPVWSLSFTPDGKGLVAFSGSYGSGKVIVWDIATGKRVVEAGADSRGLLGCAAVSRDGKFLAGTNGRDLYIWKADGEQVARMNNLRGEAATVAFSPDGKTLVVTGGDLQDTLLELRDATTAKRLRKLDGHAKGTAAAYFTPDGKLVVSVGADKMVRIWDVATGKLTATLEVHEQIVESLAIRADGKGLASGDLDGVVRLWDLPGGKNTAVLKGHPGTALGLSFSPDGKLLAVATGTLAGSGEVWLWDTATGKKIAVIDKQDLPVRAVAFSPDGKTLASVCGFDPVLLWDVASLTAKKQK